MTIEPFPIPTKILLETPLYQEIKFGEKQIWGVIDFLYWPGTYDAFCTGCGKEATFKVISKNRPPEHNQRLLSSIGISGNSRGTSSKVSIDKGLYGIEAQCTRSEGHRHVYIFHIDYPRQPWQPYGFKCTEGSIIKIGQYPSYADFNISEIDRFKPVLEKQSRKEFVRAIGLAAHGIGIGSFVYLRRIFESLVEEAYNIAISADTSFDKASYTNARMDEKIKLLKAHLPSTLCKNAKLYSVLSIGIHALTEEECNRYFVIVRSGIELILNEKLRSLEEEKSIKQIEKELQDLHSDLQNNQS